MLDIETTGIDPKKEELLQVGILEVDIEGGYWQPGRSLEITVPCFAQPKSSFAKEHMVALYRKCNELYHRIGERSPESIRAQILKFFNDCGAVSPEVYIMGWNASSFDIPFLVEKQCLIPSSYVSIPGDKDVQVGDVHYRVYEMSGAISIAQNVLKLNRKTLLERAETAYDMKLPKGGKQHNALYDCYQQTKVLNGILKLVREGNNK